MVHRSIRNGSRVADELYIKRVLWALEDFLFFTLYSFSCIAKQDKSLKQLRLLSCLVLAGFPRNKYRALGPAHNITIFLPISPTHDPSSYTITSHYNIIPDITCAYIPRQGVSIVPNFVLFLVGFT